MLAQQTMCATAHSPALARAFVAESLEKWSAPVDCDDAVLVASELSTNAFRYNGPHFTISVGWDSCGVWIEVEDDEPNAPAMQRALDDAESGRGLAIVEALSVSCEVHPTPAGKTVRATLSAEHP